jgi:hypothetical protein
MTIGANWDDSGLHWDSGLQWDVNVGPNLGDIAPYLSLITSEHADKPNYLTFVATFLQPVADIIAQIKAIPALFDLDTAVGEQLDFIGQWVGRSRYLTTALPNVYFSFDTAGLGFDQAVWQGPFDPTTGLTALPDDSYRTLLRATIAANQWDGTIPGAYNAWNVVFSGTGTQILIQDNGDMTMLFGLVGTVPDAVTKALLTGGYLALKPAGVRITGYYVSSAPGTPLFGFDADTSVIGGFDVGSWATPLSPT